MDGVCCEIWDNCRHEYKVLHAIHREGRDFSTIFATVQVHGNSRLLSGKHDFKWCHWYFRQFLKFCQCSSSKNWQANLITSLVLLDSLKASIYPRAWKSTETILCPMDTILKRQIGLQLNINIYALMKLLCLWGRDLAIKLTCEFKINQFPIKFQSAFSLGDKRAFRQVQVSDVPLMFSV